MCAVASCVFRRLAGWRIYLLIGNDTGRREMIWPTAVFAFIVLGLFSFIESAYDGSGSRCGIHARIRGQKTRGALFPLPFRVLRLVDNEAFLKLFDDSSFDLTYALLAPRSTQEVDQSESSSFGWFPYFLAEVSTKRVEAFLLCGRKQGTDGKLLPSKTLPEAIVTCLSG